MLVGGSRQSLGTLALGEQVRDQRDPRSPGLQDTELERLEQLRELQDLHSVHLECSWSAHTVVCGHGAMKVRGQQSCGTSPSTWKLSHMFPNNLWAREEVKAEKP